MPAQQSRIVTQISVRFILKGKLREVLKDLRVTVTFSLSALVWPLVLE